MQEYEHIGKELADRIFHLLRSQPARSIYITGNGPNVATAMQAALILSECTKIGFNGLAMAQYDHGPKETAKNSIVLMINAAGEAAERTEKLAVTIRNAGAEVFIINEPKSSEQFSILYNILPLNFLAYYLAEKMQVKGTFVVGSKITEI